MASPTPRTPDDLASACATRFERRHREWLADPPNTAVETVRLGTAPPAARRAAEHPTDVAAWIRLWRDFAARVGDRAAVEWADRRLPGFGVVELPQRVVVTGPDAIASVAGFGRRWSRLRARVELLTRLVGAHVEAGSDALAAVRRAAAVTSATWERWEDADIDRLGDVCRWALDNPTEGLRAREIAVPGIDTKWIESRRRVVEALFESAHDAPGGGSPDGLGLLSPEARVRIRVLDRALGFPLVDVESPVSELGGLWAEGGGPNRLVVVENLTTFLALPPLPGTVAVFGRGFAVDAVAALPWAVRATVDYWGDLDSHGFAILDRLRAHLPAVRSVLMDAETLAAWRALAVPDPTPTRSVLPRLTREESEVLESLTLDGDLRLEQERIPWDWALARLRPSAPAIRE